MRSRMKVLLLWQGYCDQVACQTKSQIASQIATRIAYTALLFTYQ